MRHVPWVTLILAVIFCVTPPAQSIIHSAFFSGEQLANSISQFILLCCIGIVCAAAAIEWGLKAYLRRRANRLAK